MGVVSKKRSIVIRQQAQTIITEKGAKGIVSMANDMKMTWRVCKPCEVKTPSLETIDTCECLVCGTEQKY